MVEHKRPLHLVGGGEVLGPNAPVGEEPAAAAPAPIAYGPGGGTAAAASDAFGHYAEEQPARRPAARRPAAPPPRTLDATNIARRDNFAGSVSGPSPAATGAGFEPATETPESERIGIPVAPTFGGWPAPSAPSAAPLPTPSSAPTVVRPGPVAPPRPAAARGPRTLAATNIARRDNFADSVDGPTVPAGTGFEPAE